jgi:hypothetical protein
MYVRTLFLVLLAQASAWQLASPVSSRSVVRRSCSPVAMDGLVDAAHVDTAQQIFVLVAEKVDSGKAFDEISKSAGPIFDSAVKTAGPLLESAGKEAGKAIEAAIPELQKGFEASKPVLQQTANDLAPVAKQAADIVAPVLQQARSRLVQMQYRRRVVSCGAHMLQQSPVQRRQMLCRGMVRVLHQARWYICSTEWWLADSCGTHTTPYTTHHAPRTTHHAPRTRRSTLPAKPPSPRAPRSGSRPSRRAAPPWTRSPPRYNHRKCSHGYNPSPSPSPSPSPKPDPQS